MLCKYHVECFRDFSRKQQIKRKFLLMNEAFFPSNLNTCLRHLFQSQPTHVLMLLIPSIYSVFFFPDSIYTLVIGHVLQSMVALLITSKKNNPLHLLCREINICFTPLHSHIELFGTRFALIFSCLFCISPVSYALLMFDLLISALKQDDISLNETFFL